MDTHERIKARRKQLNISQERLAKEAGYSDKSSISKIEKGLVTVPMERLVALCIPLKTSIGYLLGLTDDPDDESTPNADYYIEMGKINQEAALQSLVSRLAVYVEHYQKCSIEDAFQIAANIVKCAAREDMAEVLTLYDKSDPNMQQAVLTILRSGKN